MSIANKDDKLISLRANFGLWGIGAYWTIVEFAAEQITENSEKAEATLIVSELIGFFGCKRNKLETFLEHSRNISLFDYEINGNILKINIEKLLKYADNYIKYDGKSLKTLQRQNKMSSKQDIDIDKDIEKKENTVPPDWNDVSNLWKERKYVDGEDKKFFSYYTANGWRVGKNPMKDWKAAAAGWNMRSKDYNPPKPIPPNSTTQKKYTCKYCNKEMPESQQYGHWQSCPNFKPASQETINEARSAIDMLTKKFKV